MQEARSKFFNRMMEILDNAEAKEGATGGAFGFLWDNSYVKRVVVSSFKSTHTNIVGLKMFLARNILKMYPERRTTKSGGMTFKQLKEIVDGTAKGHKYQLDYSVMDDCMDNEKNKKAMLEGMHAPIEDADMIKYIEECKVWFPYIFMDKLREEVWFRLREFSKLCDQKTCSECLKKSEVYFQFIQAVALYEIFYIELVQECAAEYTEQVNELTKKLQENQETFNSLTVQIKNAEPEQRIESIFLGEEIFAKFQELIEAGGEKESSEESIYKAGVFQLLVIEFAISLHAMCDLLMIFEAVQVWDPKMRGIKHLSKEIHENLANIYEKELYVLETANKKRYKRHREANIYLERLQKNRFPGCEDWNVEDEVNKFLEELDKPVPKRNRNVLRGFEVMLAYPVYKEESVFGRKREE